MVLHVRNFWVPYFIFANSVYLLICWIIIELTAAKFSQAIITLAGRVKSNVKNIQKLRNYKQMQEDGEFGGAKFSMADMQIDLLKGYVAQNRETNDLYFSFNSMARVIFLGYQSTQQDVSYQALQNMHSCVEVFSNQKNQHAAGICYMNLGCMTAA